MVTSNAPEESGTPPILNFVGTTTIALSENHDPEAYYQNRDDLSVSEDFLKLIVAKAKPTPAGATFTLAIAEISFEYESLTDDQIEGALPEGYLFDETKVCAIAAGITAQPPGYMASDLRGAFLYTKSRVVSLWRGGGRGRGEWHVNAWEREDRPRFSGNKVISETAA